MNIFSLDFAMISSTIIGYFISIALFTSSFYKGRANNYLALSLFLVSSLTFLAWLGIIIPDNIFVIMFSNFKFDILFGTTLFTYFLIQIKHSFYNGKWYKWLYLPFISCVILEIPVYFFNLYGSILEFILFFFRDTASIFFNMILIFYSRKLIIETKVISNDKKRWLLRLNLFIVILIVCWFLTRLEAYIYQSYNLIYVLWIGMCLFFWWVLYYGVFRLQIIAQKEELHSYLISHKKPNTKSKNKSANTSKIINQLFKLMEDEELYKNPLLSRLDIATQLNISESYLSQIINQEINKSVIQFVNEYRIEEAKNLLQDPMFNKYSIEAIGMEAGFKSKSAFYSTFNTSLKMSPGAYRKLQKTS